ncbi:MAG: hypothetical protein WCQ53_03840, partial [bacterium]
MIKQLYFYAALFFLSIIANAQNIDHAEIDKIANTSLKDFVTEGQKKFGVKTASELNAVPIHPDLNGVGSKLVPGLVKEFKAEGKEWITKDLMLSPSPRDGIINAKIVHALKRKNGARLGKEAYILPMDGSGKVWTMVLEKAPGINIKQLYEKPKNYFIAPISEIMGKEYTELKEAASDFSKAVLREKETIKEIEKILSSVFSSNRDLQIMVVPSVNGSISEWNVIDTEDFSYSSYASATTTDRQSKFIVTKLNSLVIDLKMTAYQKVQNIVDAGVSYVNIDELLNVLPKYIQTITSEKGCLIVEEAIGDISYFQYSGPRLIYIAQCLEKKKKEISSGYKNDDINRLELYTSSTNLDPEELIDLTLDSIFSKGEEYFTDKDFLTLNSVINLINDPVYYPSGKYKGQTEFLDCLEKMSSLQNYVI